MGITDGFFGLVEFQHQPVLVGQDVPDVFLVGILCYLDLDESALNQLHDIIPDGSLAHGESLGQIGIGHRFPGMVIDEIQKDPPPLDPVNLPGFGVFFVPVLGDSDVAISADLGLAIEPPLVGGHPFEVYFVGHGRRHGKAPASPSLPRTSANRWYGTA